jgi:acetoin utilization protein AcuB
VHKSAPAFFNLNLKMKKNIPVSRVMSRAPIFVAPGTSIDHIHRLFEEYDFHHLPVVDRGKVTGMISKSDYLKVRHMLSYSWSGIVGINDAYTRICARDIMSSPVLMIEPSDTVGLAADIFLSNRLHALPVVRDDELVGIVTSHDLLHYSFVGVRESETVTL